VASADFAVSDVDRDDVDLVSVDGSFLPARDSVSSLSDSPALDFEAAAAASHSGGAS
jgi:hypothetical protein